MALPEILEDLEKQLILKAYGKAKGVKTETARLLGIKTSALYYKLEKYGIGTIESRESRGEKGGAATGPGQPESDSETLLGDGPAAGGGGREAGGSKPR
jgi:hypothetical protein